MSEEDWDIDITDLQEIFSLTRDTELLSPSFSLASLEAKGGSSLKRKTGVKKTKTIKRSSGKKKPCPSTQTAKIEDSISLMIEECPEAVQNIPEEYHRVVDLLSKRAIAREFFLAMRMLGQAANTGDDETVTALLEKYLTETCPYLVDGEDVGGKSYLKTYILSAIENYPDAMWTYSKFRYSNGKVIFEKCLSASKSIPEAVLPSQEEGAVAPVQSEYRVLTAGVVSLTIDFNLKKVIRIDLEGTMNTSHPLPAPARDKDSTTSSAPPHSTAAYASISEQ